MIPLLITLPDFRAADDSGYVIAHDQVHGPSTGHRKMTSILPFLTGRTLALELTEDHVASILDMRRARIEIFGENLFADPAWDILLELYAAKLANRKVPLLDLAKATRAPVSTVSRWIGILRERGLICSDVGTETVHFFQLTPEGDSKLHQLLVHWAAAFVSAR